jgi:hypothetical protein
MPAARMYSSRKAGSGKSVYSIAFVKTTLPLPSSQVSVLPELKLLASNAFFVTLREGDLVEKPIGPASVRHIFRPVRKQHIPHDPVPVPLFAARELRQIGRIQ